MVFLSIGWIVSVLDHGVETSSLFLRGSFEHIIVQTSEPATHQLIEDANTSLIEPQGDARGEQRTTKIKAGDCHWW